MTGLFPSIRLLWRALAVLAMLVVAAHALTPATTPFERVAGSAFSAATHDVAIGGLARAAIGAENRVGDKPVPSFGVSGLMRAEGAMPSEKLAYQSYRRSHADPPELPIWSRGPPSV